VSELGYLSWDERILRVTEEIVVAPLITLVKSSKPIPMRRRGLWGNEGRRLDFVIPLQM
jgi:hypothetical protein